MTLGGREILRTLMDNGLIHSPTYSQESGVVKNFMEASSLCKMISLYKALLWSCTGRSKSIWLLYSDVKIYSRNEMKLLQTRYLFCKLLNLGNLKTCRLWNNIYFFKEITALSGSGISLNTSIKICDRWEWDRKRWWIFGTNSQSGNTNLWWLKTLTDMYLKIIPICTCTCTCMCMYIQ